jgi:membrane protein YqaA with SNARE-associated domain
LHFPTDLASFLDLIHEHGDAAYSLMFAYAASHSLLLALFAGYAAHSGALSVGTLIMVCWFGSFVGDAIRFWIGRRFGTRWLGSFPKLERAVQTAGRLADRHYVWMILFHRYPHGIRGVAGFAYGISQLPWPTFLALNFVRKRAEGQTFHRLEHRLNRPKPDGVCRLHDKARAQRQSSACVTARYGEALMRRAAYLRAVVSDQSGAAGVLEMDRGYGCSPPRTGIVLVCQANFRAVWGTNNRFDHLSRFFFAVCPHTNNCTQSHFKCVLVHDSLSRGRLLAHQKNDFRCGDSKGAIRNSGFKRQLAAQGSN